MLKATGGESLVHSNGLSLILILSLQRLDHAFATSTSTSFLPLDNNPALVSFAARVRHNYTVRHGSAAKFMEGYDFGQTAKHILSEREAVEINFGVHLS